MDAERWRRIKQLFGDALDQPLPGRGAWLEAAADDPALAAEVGALLAAHEQADSRLEEGAAALVPDLWQDLRTAVAGGRIGPYRIVSELGRGGMGAVYLATRDEAGFEQQVALKLIKRGMDTDGIVRRFLQERRILAGLVHPNIARLYDGGSTPDGRPYFVMEYVAGEPVTRFAADLETEARLGLFLKVCAAVQYAHQRLIVHRDLKPANILVGADGEPKLLDFGIAKLLDPSGGSGGPQELTEAHQRPMTPDYASPEQLDGGAVTTATDVYGLGVLLYELLVGMSPAAVERRLGPGWAERPPSQAVRALAALEENAEGKRLARRLRGDLDTLIATARERDAGRRYGTAAALAEDVERHLTHRPVRARRPTLAYRLGRAARRHKLAAAFAVFLVLFAATAAWQAWQIDQQRKRAEAFSELLERLFRGADPEQNRGEALTVRELLDQGSRRLVDEPGIAPEIRADFLGTVGEVYANLGLYGDAEKHLRRALDLRSREGGREAGREQAGLLTLLGHVAWQRGDGPEARRRYERAMDLERRLDGPRALPLAEDLNGLGLVAAEAGDPAGAARHFAAAIAIARGAGPEGRKSLADGLNNQGWLARRQGDLAAAQASFAGSLRLSREVLGDSHPETVRVRSNLAAVLFQRGDLEGAAGAFQEILAVRRRLLGPDHPDIARTLNNLGTVEEKRGRLPQARGSFREALAMSRRLAPPQEGVAAVALDGLAAIARRQGDPASAEAAYAESCELLQRRLGDDPQAFANALQGLAGVQRDRGRPAAAADTLRRGIDRLAAVGGTGPQIAQVRRLLARLEPAGQN